MFFGTQNIQFLTFEFKICCKGTKENTDQPFDMSCKYQEGCLLIIVSSLISTFPALREILVHVEGGVQRKLSATYRKVGPAKKESNLAD